MNALLAFAAGLLTLRLSGLLATRWRLRRRPELAAWGLSLLAFAVACGALAWGAAAGWDVRSFRVYYLFGGLLTAPLLGAGSLLLTGRRWAAPAVIAYAGLAVGLVLAAPVAGGFGSGIPDAQAHLDLFPTRLVAVAGNVGGTLAAIAVALSTIRARPVGNGLIVAGLAVAAVGSALAGLGEAETALSFAVAAALLYAGFVAAPRQRGAEAARPDPRPSAST